MIQVSKLVQLSLSKGLCGARHQQHEIIKEKGDQPEGEELILAGRRSIDLVRLISKCIDTIRLLLFLGRLIATKELTFFSVPFLAFDATGSVLTG